MPGPRPKYAITLAPEQEARLQHLSTCYRAPFATVQRAQIVLLAHHHPEWQNAAIAQRVGCHVNTVKRWRQRWQTTAALGDAPRRAPGVPLRRSSARRSWPWRAVRRASTASPGRGGRARSWRRWREKSNGPSHFARHDSPLAAGRQD